MTQAPARLALLSCSATQRGKISVASPPGEPGSGVLGGAQAPAFGKTPWA